MQVVSLDEIEYKLDTKSKPRGNASALHKEALQLLRELYPVLSICEEIPIKTYQYKTLYLDLFIPSHLIAIEVHGQQHATYSSYFYFSKQAFLEAKQRDQEKRDWCNKNDIVLLEFSHNEPRDEWRRKVRRAIESALRPI